MVSSRPIPKFRHFWKNDALYNKKKAAPLSAFRLIILAVLLTLSGCTTFHATAPKLTTDHGARLEKTWYHAEVRANDGTLIRMTVYQPALKQGETAPLLLHAHGFGLGRMARPFSIYGKLLLAGKAAIRAWDEGYWVISFDDRGHGDSEGRISLIDPDREVSDVSRIIDWAVQNLAVTQEKDDPLVGMIGESYGGGIQMLASVEDPRIDALIPITTWYNLDQALFPNGVAKSDWMTFLGAVGYVRSPFHMDNNAVAGGFKEIFGDGAPADLHKRLRNNSLVDHCNRGQGPHADALLIQGMRDVLFPLNHALKARQCFIEQGHDARLIAIEHGHLMPGSQWSPGLPVWYVQPEVHCGGKTYKTADIINDWLNGKLRGDKAALERVPEYCVTGDASVDQSPPVLTWEALPKVHMGSGASGWLEFIAEPMDELGHVLSSSKLPADWQAPSDGTVRPARIPLYVANEPTWIAGIPQVDLNFSDSNRPNATVFLRLAVWRPGSGSYRVLNQEVTPVRANGPHRVELAAVRDKLEAGDILGLLVQGHSNQFRLAGSGFFTKTSIEGTIGLPLQSATSGAVARQGATTSTTP